MFYEIVIFINYKIAKQKVDTDLVKMIDLEMLE